MKMAYKIAIGAALVVAAAGVAVAASGPHRFGAGEHSGMKMFEQADANADGAITAGEMTTALSTRFKEADANGDAAVTKAEVLAAFEKHAQGRMARHSGRFADQMLARTDINDDGKVELSELENRAKKHFALMDFNDDGKVEKTEIGRGRHAGMGRHHGGGWGGKAMQQMDDGSKAAE